MKKSMVVPRSVIKKNLKWCVNPRGRRAWRESSALRCKAATEERLFASPDDAGAFLFDTGLITTIQRFICSRGAQGLSCFPLRLPLVVFDIWLIPARYPGVEAEARRQEEWVCVVAFIKSFFASRCFDVWHLHLNRTEKSRQTYEINVSLRQWNLIEMRPRGLIKHTRRGGAARLGAFKSRPPSRFCFASHARGLIEFVEENNRWKLIWGISFLCVRARACTRINPSNLLSRAKPLEKCCGGSISKSSLANYGGIFLLPFLASDCFGFFFSHTRTLIITVKSFAVG